ncbi:hypothetical protein DICVIV_02134 [Dictyocaulus viviparus]|uniref:SCP domain-containing protein n=1 Tax=Dictyocaulus viviparus TaxID=29172 RepID=A0A0D8Y4D3_DICVI|nr:hypothetical protein DICVIV_02134 [Dictyocaulus viviparus]
MKHSMIMNGFVTLLTLAVVIQSSFQQGYQLDAIEECHTEADMNNDLRLLTVALHNTLRSALANGTQIKRDGGTFPRAEDMRLLKHHYTVFFPLKKYDCNFERQAFRLAQSCVEVTEYDFDHVGNNSALLHLSRPTVKRDQPIYTEGEPCGTCPDNCVFSLCNITTTSHEH